MNDRQLSQALHDITTQEIPDNMNLLPNIQEQLQDLPRKRRTIAMSFTRIAAALVFLAACSTFAYAFFQAQGFDQGLEAADRAGLFTELNMTETVGGITVTLDRAYADAHRVNLHYASTYDAAEVAEPEGGFSLDWRLFNADTGEELPAFLGGGGGGGSEDGSTIIKHVGESNFDASGVPSDSETVNLRMQLSFNAPPAGSSMPQGGNGGGTGGGGGGGTSESGSGTPGVTFSSQKSQQVPADEFEPIVFNFEFSLPYIPSINVESDETVTVGDISTTIGDLEIAPSLTNLPLCVDGLDPKHEWVAFLTIESAEAFYNSTMTFVPDDNGSQCVNSEITMPYIPGEETEWQISIPFIRSDVLDTNENAQALQSMMIEAGYESVVFTSRNTGEPTLGFGMGMVTSSDSDMLMNIDRDLQHSYGEIGTLIEGPWEFTVQIP